LEGRRRSYGNRGWDPASAFLSNAQEGKGGGGGRRGRRGGGGGGGGGGAGVSEERWGFFFDWGGFRRHGQVVSNRRKNGYGADPYLASFDETLKEEEEVHPLSLRKTDTNKHIHLGPRKNHNKITTYL
jgi:hypothetical protein